jgi:hypothetical protein
MTAVLTCKGEQRRQAVRDRGLNGIDFIEVLCPDQVSLCVHLFSKGLETIRAANIRIGGGTRIRDIRVEDVTILKREDPELEDCLRIRLDKAGDFSTYTLSLVEVEDGKVTDRTLAGFDPRYASAGFSFKVCCDTGLDCKKTEACPPEKEDEPVIDYLAKDYPGFRQLILDRLALVMPGWVERHIPDLGIALVELFAYTGDYLSYHQDAVATEAYLATARHRISVRRHARLVDYAMHEGCNARAFVCLRTGSDITDLLHPDGMFFVTASALDAPEGTVLNPDDLKEIPLTDYEVFEPLTESPDPIPIYKAHNEILFYPWENRECCLPRGSTGATLKDGWVGHQVPDQTGQDTAGQQKTKKTDSGGEEPDTPAPRPRRMLDNLDKGDILIFEEVTGPETGNPADADPAHRQAVRLTSVERGLDPLNGQPVVEITWAPEDALTFPLCLSATLPAPDCTFIEDISVARGNVVPVDHGRSTNSGDLGTVGIVSREGRCDCQGIADVVSLPGKFFTILPEKPVTFRESPDLAAPASAMLVQDPRRALPQVLLTGTDPSLPGAAAGGTTLWYPGQDLLDSWEGDRVFVVEVNDQGCACLRFGDGEQGKMPEAGMTFSARYRTGNGPDGNVGAESIKYLVLRKTHLSGVSIQPRNPLPATGGTAPEPVEEVRLIAPHAYRKRLERAVTADDYAEIAARNPKLQNAAAALRWSGSWYEAQVAVDPSGTEELQQDLEREIEGDLHPFRRMGHDVAVITAEYVPLDLTLTVCVGPDFLEEHVKTALLDCFSNRILPNGTYGFFHPDRLTFGGGIAITSVIAAAQAVPGVSCVLAVLKRLGDDDTKALEDGILSLGPLEIARLDNDPSFPEHGKLTLVMGGGR